LIEVIAALILLAVGILGLSAVVAVTGEQTRLAHVRTKLRAIGQERMESLLAGGFDDLSDGGDQQRRYEIDWSVVGDDPKQVTLVVSHSQGKSEAADTLATLVSRP
jgi:Tfp pilus assembly protein PilV